MHLFRGNFESGQNTKGQLESEVHWVPSILESGKNGGWRKKIKVSTTWDSKKKNQNSSGKRKNENHRRIVLKLLEKRVSQKTIKTPRIGERGVGQCTLGEKTD